MKEHTHEAPEIQRMRILFTQGQGFDDTDISNGTIGGVVSKDCLLYRNTEQASKKKSEIFDFRKWIKGLRHH